LSFQDPGSKFLELSPLAGYDLYDGSAHSAGVHLRRQHIANIVAASTVFINIHKYSVHIYSISILFISSLDTALYHTQPVAWTFRLQQSGACHGLSRLVPTSIWAITVFVIVGIVTGIGLVHGREVLFVANDATVKGRLFTVDTFHESQLLLYLPSFRRLPMGLKFFI
jgi:acetyl-CoA carboxylase carboxyltransferase component